MRCPPNAAMPALAFLLAVQAVAGQQKQPQFNVRVDLVSLDVEVLDLRGQPMAGLAAKDFIVRENDEPKAISSFAWVTDQPVSLTVILDTSAITSDRLSLAREFILLLAHVLARKDEVCLYTFDYRDAYLERDFTTDRTLLVDALENIGVTSGKKHTFFRDFMGKPPRLALCIDLAMMHAGNAHNERRALLVVSNRHKGLGGATLDHAREAGWPIFNLIFAEDRESLATLEQDQTDKGQLARESGGRQFSSQGEDMARTCHSIAYSLKNHYTMTYLTEIRSPEQQQRRIEVLVPSRPCIIHTRRSYVTKRP